MRSSLNVPSERPSIYWRTVFQGTRDSFMCTMKNLTFFCVLILCSLSWISASVSDSHIMEVRSGGEVTLTCSNFSTVPTQIIWFRVTRTSLPHSICSIFKPEEPARFSSGFQNGKFEVSTNLTTVFLKIRQVDSLDSGLYFCGYKSSNNLVIVEATNLDVQGVFDGITNVLSVILGALAVHLIIVVVCLAVKIKKLQKAALAEERHTQHSGL